MLIPQKSPLVNPNLSYICRFVAFWASSKDLAISFADEVINPNCSLPSIASLRLNFISFEAIYFESFIWSVNYKATPLHKLIPFAIWKADKSQKISK